MEGGIRVLNLAQRLKKTRESKKISVYKLAQASGISETHIRDLERGDRNPSFDTLSRLAKPLGLSLADLLREKEEPFYLNAEEAELISCFRAMTDEQAERLLNFLKTIS